MQIGRCDHASIEVMAVASSCSGRAAQADRAFVETSRRGEGSRSGHGVDRHAAFHATICPDLRASGSRHCPCGQSNSPVTCTNVHVSASRFPQIRGPGRQGQTTGRPIPSATSPASPWTSSVTPAPHFSSRTATRSRSSKNASVNASAQVTFNTRTRTCCTMHGHVAAAALDVLLGGGTTTAGQRENLGIEPEASGYEVKPQQGRSPHVNEDRVAAEMVQVG